MRKLTDVRAGRQALSSPVVKVPTAALALARQRLPVFPCDPLTKRPLTEHGFKDATQDEAQITRWWRAYPQALIGVPTGAASGLVAIDVDPKGREWYWREKPRLGRYRLHQTRRGKHLLYRLNGEQIHNSTGELAAGVDIRGEGGFVIWWPAHGMMSLGEPGELPAWLVERLRARAEPDAPLHHEGAQPAPDEWLTERPRVIQALAQLDPDMAHDEWRDVASSLSWATQGTQDGEDIFVNFSRGDYASTPSQKFPGEAQVRKKYRSFKNDKDRNVTLASLYQMVKEARGKVPPGRVEKKKANGADAHIVTRTAAEIAPEPIDWLWQGQQARGILQLIAGDGGQAKSTVMLDFAARISRGAEWPDGSQGTPPGSVLIWNGEDSAAQTVVPRLKVAGANLDNIHFLYDVKDGQDKRPFDPALDMPLIRSTIVEFSRLKRAPVKYLIVDPIVSALEGGRDSNTSSHVSKALEPLARLAEELNIGIGGVHHFSKNPPPGAKLVHMVTGSHVFGTKPRIVHTVVEDVASADETRLWILAKINNGKPYGAWRYRIAVVRFKNEKQQWITTTKIDWLECVPGSPEEIAASAALDGTTPRLEQAQVFLQTLLAEGPKDYQTIGLLAQKLGIKGRTLANAKKAVGVVSDRVGGTHGKWVWRLED